MKKLYVLIMAAIMAIAIAMPANAAKQCQTTLTSPAIVKVGCEIYGSVTFSFEAATVLTAGDWWYMDLPGETYICDAIDYLIFAGTANTIADTATINTASTAETVAFAGAATFIPIAIAPGASWGPMSVTDLGGGLAPALTAGVGIAIRVHAAANSQRVWIEVYGVTGVGVDAITVGAASTLNLTILDGNQHTGMIKCTSTANVYGGSLADTITAAIPAKRNTLCVNSTAYTGSTVFVSFDSDEDFLTFTGDAQIAHVASANSLSLTYCKGDITGNIPIAAQTLCTLDYETPAGYCATGSYTGNRIILTGATTFGDPGDKFDLACTITTPGVYFSGVPAVTGFTTAQDECATPVGGTAVGAAFSNRNEAGTANVAYPGSSCAVAAVNRVRAIATGNGNITGIDLYNKLYINFAAFVYDTTVIGNATEVTVGIHLSKYPCGEIFVGTRTVGTFVTACTTAAVAVNTTLMYPLITAMDGTSSGDWWSGFTIVNGSGTAGTAALVFTEIDGDVATFTTPSIPAGGHWNAGDPNSNGDGSTLLSVLTTTATGFGNENCIMIATCAFTRGGGFAFIGNNYGQGEGTGYTAYVLDATGTWQ